MFFLYKIIYVIFKIINFIYNDIVKYFIKIYNFISIKSFIILFTIIYYIIKFLLLIIYYGGFIIFFLIDIVFFFNKIWIFVYYFVFY